MEQTIFKCSLGNTVSTDEAYLTVNEIIELTNIKIHTARRICLKLAETKPKVQIQKKNGQWFVLHSLIRYFSENPKRKYYVLGTIAPKNLIEPNILIAVIEFFAKQYHPFDIQYSIERNKNKNWVNEGYHLHFVTERRSINQMKREIKTLCESNVDIRDIKLGEKQKTLDYISKEGPIILVN